MWCRRQATNYKNCLDIVRQFTQKDRAASAVSRVTGSAGRVYGVSASENSIDGETFTIECTTGGGDGVAKFSVTGDGLTGSAAEATAGELYSIPECSFIIVSDGDTFVAGGTPDKWTFSTDASTAEWEQDRWDTDYDGAGGYELIQHGIGDGTDEIYVGYNTKTAGGANPYWNWLVTGLTGYNAHFSGKDKPMEIQPGYSPYYDCMNNESFWFECIATSRHIKVIPTAVSGEQGGSYLGFILPHATPSQWTYPMFGGGSTDTLTEVVGSTLDRHTSYWAAFSDEKSGAVWDVSAWKEINRFQPRHYGDFSKWRSGVDGNMRSYPALPVDEATGNVYGQLEGVYYPSPFTPAPGLLSAGDIITVPDMVAICYKDISRTTAGSMIAMDLMGDV